MTWSGWGKDGDPPPPPMPGELDDMKAGERVWEECKRNFDDAADNSNQNTEFNIFGGHDGTHARRRWRVRKNQRGDGQGRGEEGGCTAPVPSYVAEIAC